MDGSILGHQLTRTTNFNHLPARRSDGVTARLVLDDEGFREALAVRYEAYVAAGYLAPRRDALFSDTYDESPLSKTLVLYTDGEAAASVRVCMLGHRDGNDRPGDLPAAAMFRTEIDTCLAGLAAEGRPAGVPTHSPNNRPPGRRRESARSIHGPSRWCHPAGDSSTRPARCCPPGACATTRGRSPTGFRPRC